MGEPGSSNVGNDSSPNRQRKRRLADYSYAVFVILIVYVLSSGPVIGLACWLREATGYDQFYAVFLLYYPLGLLDFGNVVSRYIEWWVVDVFHTVGPG